MSLKPGSFYHRCLLTSSCTRTVLVLLEMIASLSSQKGAGEFRWRGNHKIISVRDDSMKILIKHFEVSDLKGLLK